jgi:hypothetical protein
MPLRSLVPNSVLPTGMAGSDLLEAWRLTDEFLAEVPSLFDMSSNRFYSILNQRNLSGLVGEIFKHAMHRATPGLIPNPHPDGRPDLLDLRMKAVAAYFAEECFDPVSNAPIRTMFAPFKFGGLEIKATIGGITRANGLGIGLSRAYAIKGINYWAHHRHKCDLIGLYYDFDENLRGSPQIKAIFFASIEEEHWEKVSTGKPGRKKTSNTSLTKEGRSRIMRGIVAFDNNEYYSSTLRRIGVPIPDLQ